MYIIYIQFFKKIIMQQSGEIIDPLHKILKELGLTDLEIKLYTLSLSVGPSLVSKLSEHLGISRPNIYKIIKGLEKHGLTRFSNKKGYNRRFIVDSPSKIIELLRNKQRQLKIYDEQITPLIPNLLAIYKQGEASSKIRIEEDRAQLTIIFAKIFEEAKDEILFMGSTKDLDELVTFTRLQKHIKHRVSRGIKARILVFHDEDAEILKKDDQEELRETRFIKNLKPFSPSFYLFANKVILWQPKAPLAIIIEDEYISEMKKNIFENIWDNSI